MGLIKSSGNMYPWVTHMHAALGGECPHKCSYCYVDNPSRGKSEKYQGPIRLIKKEMTTNFGSGNTIFIEHMNDLFSYGVPDQIVYEVLDHCKQYPKNMYIFQTKNPARYLGIPAHRWPQRYMLGVTIETNRVIPGVMNFAPSPISRFAAMAGIYGAPKFVTIEPIMDFDMELFIEHIEVINPEFVNIGADSKGHKLPEPSAKKISRFIEELGRRKIEIREKHNLDRILR